MWSGLIRFLFGKKIARAVGGGLFFLLLTLFFGASDKTKQVEEDASPASNAE